MNYAFVEPWHRFLPREGGHVVGLMGSGGKTSLLRIFADTYRSRGVPTIMTTTTRCEILPGVDHLTWADLDDTPAADLPATFFLSAGVGDDAKWRGLETDQVDELGRRFPRRVVLVEVDGAAKHPVKLYRPGEPCWPARTSLAVVVMGTAAIGERVGEVLHRFGRQTFAPLAEVAASDDFVWDHLRHLLLAEGGYLAQVPAGVPALLALTGLDDLADSVGLFDFVGRAMADERLPLIVFCGLGSTPPTLRTACRREPSGPGPAT